MDWVTGKAYVNPLQHKVGCEYHTNDINVVLPPTPWSGKETSDPLSPCLEK